jgi:hypothetical protein
VQVLGEDGEPREQRVADQWQQHRLADREDHPRDGERDPRNGQQPVRVAVDRLKALDHAGAWLALVIHRAQDHVEHGKAADRECEQESAGRNQRRARRTPRLAPRLDQHVGFAPGNAGELRLPGPRLRPHRLIVQRLLHLSLLLLRGVIRVDGIDGG